MTAVAIGDRLDGWLDLDAEHHPFPIALDVVRADPGVVVGVAIDQTEAHILFPTTSPGLTGTHVHIAAAFHVLGDDPSTHRTFQESDDFT